MYQPLSSIALLSIPPLLLLGLRQMEEFHAHNLLGIIWRFIALGFAVGLIALLYSGWFIWFISFISGALVFWCSDYSLLPGETGVVCWSLLAPLLPALWQ